MNLIPIINAYTHSSLSRVPSNTNTGFPAREKPVISTAGRRPSTGEKCAHCPDGPDHTRQPCLLSRKKCGYFQ